MAGESLASQFPNRPVRWVVPVPPGGSVDLVARIVGSQLSERWGYPIIIDNRVAGFRNDVWYWLLVPAATSPRIVDKVHSDVVAVLALPGVRKRLPALGADVVGNTSDEFAQLIKTETAKWARIIKAARIHAPF